jgi:hypothetical protein
MQDPDLIALFVAPLENAGIRYMITGSIASSIYGEPRNTLDIDLVVLIQSDQIPLLPRLFPEDDFYLPPADVIAIESRREAHGLQHHPSPYRTQSGYLPLPQSSHASLGPREHPPCTDSRLRYHYCTARIRHPSQTRILP